MNEIKKVALYCASSTQLALAYYQDARLVGQLLAQRGITLINGAGNMGLMRASTDACMEAGGHTVGVIPEFMVEQGWHHQGMSELVITRDMSERKNHIASISDAAIVLAGGCGTLDELFELVTNKQLGLYRKPIVILNTLGFYDLLLQHLQRAADQHFMRPGHLDLWRVAESAEEAIELVMSTPLWDANARQYAKI